jgi:AmmeMemoRadiSam system protein B
VDEVEHSVDIMLPFLQFLGFDIPVLPLVMGDFSSTHLDVFADCLSPFIPPKTLILISSDFTHYGASFGYVPFRTGIQENLRHFDLTAAELIISGNLSGFEEFLQKTHITICGHIPIRLMMHLFGSRLKGTVSGYTTSGELTGNWQQSVSYIGALFGNISRI